MLTSLGGHLKEQSIKSRKIRGKWKKEEINSLTSLPQSLPGPLPLQNGNIAGIGHFAEC